MPTPHKPVHLFDSRNNHVELQAVDGHLSADSHVHIHRHLDELYFAGSEGVLSGVGEADQDLIFRNPSGSGKVLEIIQYNLTSSVGYDTEAYFNPTYPETSGTPDGTEVTPWNLSDHSKTANFEVQHTPTGDTSNLVDETTADRQIPTGIVGGTKQNPSSTEIRGADIDLEAGTTLLFRTTLDSTNEDIGYLVLVAEHDKDRNLQP
jgi:hypothetical protein